MDRNKQRRLGVLLSYIVMASNFLVGLLYTPYMIKSLGQSEYGNYYYVSSLVSYLSLLTCGFGSAYLRFSTPYKKNHDEAGVSSINGLFLTLFLVMGSIALVLGGLMTAGSDVILGGSLTVDELATGKILMGIMVVNLFLSFPVSVFNSFIIAQEKFVFQKGLALVQAILSPCLSIIILRLGYKSVGIAIGVLAITILIDSCTIWYCIVKLKMKFTFKLNNISHAKEVFVFSSFLLLSMVVDQINWSVDKYVLGKLCGTAVVAIYTVGATINTYYKSIGEAISNVFVPEVYTLLEEENGDVKVTRLMTRLGRIQFIVLGLICSGFIVFGKSFIHLWVGDDYRASYYVILLLMIPVTIPEIQKIGLEIQKAKNLHQFRSILYAIISIVNVGISIPLSIQFGAIGAATGTAITVLIGNGLIMNIYYQRVVNLDMAFFWNNIIKLIPPVLFSLLIGVIATNLINITSWLVFCPLVVAYSVIYLISIYFVGMNQEEKRFIEKIGINLKRK